MQSHWRCCQGSEQSSRADSASDNPSPISPLTYPAGRPGTAVLAPGLSWNPGGGGQSRSAWYSPHPHTMTSHDGKAGCVYLDKRYMALTELLITSNNFFLKQNVPWLGLESISERRRREEEQEGVFFFPPDWWWCDNLGLLASCSFPWITGSCFASSNLKQISS